MENNHNLNNNNEFSNKKFEMISEDYKNVE